MSVQSRLRNPNRFFEEEDWNGLQKVLGIISKMGLHIFDQGGMDIPYIWFLSDLRDSGQIEQDSDLIAFLYRDDYYDRESKERNRIEVILAKQRNGPVGTVQLAFLKEYGRFLDLVG